MDVSIGSVRRLGTELQLTSAKGSSIDADITLSASEVLGILGKILTSGGGLVFALGLPFFWLKERFGAAPAGEAPKHSAAHADINKPW
jgi:hypothetical protein